MGPVPRELGSRDDAGEPHHGPRFDGRRQEHEAVASRLENALERGERTGSGQWPPFRILKPGAERLAE